MYYLCTTALSQFCVLLVPYNRIESVLCTSCAQQYWVRFVYYLCTKVLSRFRVLPVSAQQYRVLSVYYLCTTVLSQFCVVTDESVLCTTCAQQYRVSSVYVLPVHTPVLSLLFFPSFFFSVCFVFVCCCCNIESVLCTSCAQQYWVSSVCVLAVHNSIESVQCAYYLCTTTVLYWVSFMYCSACSVLVALVEQTSEVHNESVAHAMVRLCSYLPDPFHSFCKQFIDAAGPIIIKL